MKKLSLFVLLILLLCCVAVFAACDTSVCKDGHTPVTDAAVAPTCTEPGLTEGSHCSVCNAVITAQEAVPAKAHTESTWLENSDVKLTCTTDGALYKECTECHAVLEVKTLKSAGHTYGTWKTVAAATCTAEGSKERICTTCNEKETQIIPITHNPSSLMIGAYETCTADGFRYRTCLSCGIVTYTQTVRATGHTYNESDLQLVTPLTCTQNGVKHGTCTTCQEEFDLVSEALGHDYPDTWETVTPATCHNAGERRHACENGCGTYETETVVQLTHEKEWITDVVATCASAGSRHEECSLCHDVFAVETLNQIVHSDSDPWTVLVSATCQQKGLEARTCPNCSRNERREIPKTAHTESEWVVDLVATCHAQGSRHKSCTTCSTVLQSEVVPTLAHTPDSSWITVSAPTATQNGQSKQICRACGTTLKTSATTLNLDVSVLNEVVSQNLSTFTVVYADSCYQNNLLKSYILGDFKTALNTAAGKTITFRPASNTPDSTGKQILIGLTDHAESKRAFSTLQGRGFTVRVDGNRIVILGTDDLLTISALQYFVNNYLTDAGKTITMSQDSTAAGLPAVALSSVYGSSFAYIFDADWDIDPLHMYVGDNFYNKPSQSNGYPGDGREYPAFVYEYFLNRISQMSGLPVTAFTSVKDTVTTYQNGYEVLFGTVDRPETRAFRNTLDANQYGFRIVGNKVILAAHIDAALEPLVEKFLAFYAQALACNGGILPQGYEEVYTLSGTINGTILGSFKVPAWKLSFPRPANTELEMAENNNDDAIQLIYTGAGATVAGYEAYCQSLVDDGYTLVTNMQYDNVGETNNYFRTYKGKGTVLYVAFNAFTYQDTYAARYANESAQFGDFIHSSTVNTGQGTTQYPMRTYEQCIRIVSAPTTNDGKTTNAYLPEANLLKQLTYTKVCNSAITTIRLNRSVGMSYILTLEDGRFVIVDGGGDYDSADHDEQILYTTLKALYKDIYGTDPTAAKPIHIAAWLVTHSHADHYGTLTSFLSRYASSKTIKMDYLIGNFPHASTIYPVAGDTTVMGDGRIPTLQGYLTSAGLSAFKYVKVHTGTTLYFANLKMEVLMTTEDHAPFRITNSNDTNTVTKWTISSTEATSGSITPTTIRNDLSKTTWTLLGDSCIYASRWMCAMWGGTYNASTDLYDGGYIAANMVQLAHHGNIGCEIALYKTIQAEVVWFPHNASSYNSYTQNGNNGWTGTVDNYAVNLCPTVKYVVVEGSWLTDRGYNTDSITIDFNSDGIYFPASGNVAWGIVYNKGDGSYTTRQIPYNTKQYNHHNITRVYTSPIIKK